MVEIEHDSHIELVKLFKQYYDESVAFRNDKTLVRAAIVKKLLLKIRNWCKDERENIVQWENDSKEERAINLDKKRQNLILTAERYLKDI